MKTDYRSVNKEIGRSSLRKERQPSVNKNNNLEKTGLNTQKVDNT